MENKSSNILRKRIQDRTSAYVEQLRQKYMNDEEGRSKRPYGNIGFLNDISDTKLFQKARCHFDHELGDICIHRDITWHSAGNNISNKHRELLFIVIDVM